MIKHWINYLLTPFSMYVLFLLMGIFLIFKTQRIAKNTTLLLGGILFFVFLVFSLFDKHFAFLLLNADNIAVLVFIICSSYFVWYALKSGFQNDQRMRNHELNFFKEQQTFWKVWPNLIYIECICAILIFLFLLLWSVVFNAPLEAPANPSVTPNPAKAPWYFVGLQEMLVYFDPWLAGVVYPSLVIVSLMALPYIDNHHKPSGYFTITTRKFAIGVFLFGFLQWIFFTIIAIFFRGPGWTFFGLFEPWDINKVLPMEHINLSNWIWGHVLQISFPNNILLRESFGILLLGLYFGLIPMVLAKTVVRKFFYQIGIVRFSIVSFLLLFFLLVPVKMLLRWTLNIKYVIAFPEYLLNI